MNDYYNILCSQRMWQRRCSQSQNTGLSRDNICHYRYLCHENYILNPKNMAVNDSHPINIELVAFDKQQNVKVKKTEKEHLHYKWKILMYKVEKRIWKATSLRITRLREYLLIFYLIHRQAIEARLICACRQILLLDPKIQSLLIYIYIVKF